jgi:hypothetical protein
MRHDGGHGFSVPDEFTVAVTITSSAQTDTEPKARRAKTARSSLSRGGDSDLYIAVGDFIVLL